MDYSWFIVAAEVLLIFFGLKLFIRHEYKNEVRKIFDYLTEENR